MHSQRSVLEGMKTCHWIHLACHGHGSTSNNPSECAFALADGKLNLAEISKHSFPHAEFAFLSACDTVSGDVNYAADGIHLAAGMMFVGYRGVIATMWPMPDRDGPFIADAVYTEMLKGGKADVSRAAYALHHVVKQLRVTGASFDRWIPFIHMRV